MTILVLYRGGCKFSLTCILRVELTEHLDMYLPGRLVFVRRFAFAGMVFI